MERGATAAAAAAVEDSTYPSGSLNRTQRREYSKKKKAVREREHQNQDVNRQIEVYKDKSTSNNEIRGDFV